MMRTAFYILILLLMPPVLTVAQETRRKTRRVLFILDASLEMNRAWSEKKNKYTEASEIITGTIDSIYLSAPDVEFGLRVFGHQYPMIKSNCKDSRMEVGFSKDALSQIYLRLKDIRPKGNSALGYAVAVALKDQLIDTTHEYTLVILSGQGSDCNELNFCDDLSANHKVRDIKKYLIVLNQDGPQSRYKCPDSTFYIRNKSEADSTIGFISSFFKSNIRVSPDITQPETTSIRLGSPLSLQQHLQ